MKDSRGPRLQTCTDAHDEPRHDDDLIGLGDFADAHHHGGDDGEDVVEEEGALPVTGLGGCQGATRRDVPVDFERVGLPPQFVDQRSHHQRAEEAPQRVHGDGEGPEQSVDALLHVATVALHVGQVVELLHELRTQGSHSPSPSSD